MKNKGYTLTEVIATVTILGIVLLIAVPSISALRNAINKKRIKSDAEMFIAMAKEYVETHSDFTGGKITLNMVNDAKLNGSEYIYIEGSNPRNSYVEASSCSLSNTKYKCTYHVELYDKEYHAYGNEGSIIAERG